MAICLFGAVRLPAQQPAQQPATPQGKVAAQQSIPAANAGASALKILVLEGEGVVHDLHMVMATDLVVEVRDQNDRPVEGATVSFQAPLQGASGSFDGGVRNKDALTNVQGQASATFTPNMEVGRLTIQVKATIGGLTGMAEIMERNVTAAEQGKKSWFGRHKTLVIITAVAAVGAVLAIVLTESGSSSTTTSGTTITITPGVPNVGAP